MRREAAINKQEKNLVVMVAALFKADKLVFTDHRKLDDDDDRFNEMVTRFLKGANHSATMLTARVMDETMRVLSEPIESDESDDSEDEDDEGDKGESHSDLFSFERMVHLSKNKQGSGCMAESDQESAQTQQQEYDGAPGTVYRDKEPRPVLLSGQRMSEMDKSGARVSFSPPNKEKGGRSSGRDKKRTAGASGEAGGVQPPLKTKRKS
ncbi:hypothetical protein TeGR_g8533, partial [Tetraparma gracilis]